MNKKITRIYLSLLVFLFSFFFIYSQRFVVYDFLNTHQIYSDTLSTKDIQYLKKYLKNTQTKTLNNKDKIRKDLEPYLKNGSYQIVIYKNNKKKLVVDSVLFFRGRAPLKNIKKYCIGIKASPYNYLEWYPSFSNYYFYYRIVDCILSFGIAVLFFFFSSKIKPYKSKKVLFHSLSSKMMFTFFYSTLVVLSSFAFMYLNRSVVYEFLMDTFYASENYDSYVKEIQKDLRHYSLDQDSKKAIQTVLNSKRLNHAVVGVYDDKGIYFIDTKPMNTSTLYLYSDDDLEVMDAPLYYDYTIHFKNQTASLYITSFPMMNYQIPYTVIILFIAFSFYMVLLQNFIHNRIHSIQSLQEDVFSLAIGDWNHEIKVEDTDEIGRLGEDLNQMRLAFLRTMDNEQQARIANKELISSLSHDLRTPLTTLKGYLEIMDLKKEDKDLRNQYLRKCLDKVEEITYLSNKMFEYSLVFSTEYNVELNDISIQQVIDALVDHIQYLKEMDLHIVYEPLHTQSHMCANFAMIQRILNNVFSNIQKYCDPWKNIVIQSSIEENQLKMSFTNSINHHLEKVESNGIGLKSVKKMIELHHGTFYKTQTNDLFTVILTFPIKK